MPKIASRKHKAETPSEAELLIAAVRSLFQRFNQSLEQIFSEPAPQHPLRRRTDFLAGYATADDFQTSEQAHAHDPSPSKAVWADLERRDRQPLSTRMPTAQPAARQAKVAHQQIARVVYGLIRRSYRGRAIQPDLSGLQPVVKKVYSAVAKKPGQITDVYLKMTKMNKNTLRYALQILRQKKLIESRPASTE